MDRVARYSLFLLDFIGFLLKGALAFIFGDLIDMFSKGGRIWLIPIFLGGVAFVIALANLKGPQAGEVDAGRRCATEALTRC